MTSYLFFALLGFQSSAAQAELSCADLAKAFEAAGQCEGSYEEITACQNKVIREKTGLSPEQAERALGRCSG